MATAVEYGLIATGVSVAIITSLGAYKGKEHLFPDPVKAHYARVDAECARPMKDGRPREIVNVGGKENGGYVFCPRK